MERAQGTLVEAQQVFTKARETHVIRAAQQGDKQAYHELYKAYVGRVYALSYRLTGDRGMAEDVTQEVFIQLWRKLNNYSEQSKFTTWLHSVTANIAVSYIRKQKGWLKRVFSIEGTTVEYEQADASPDSVDLEAYILRLPERARMVFVLHAIEGYRHEEIATMLKMAVGSSKSQFHRAKQLLEEWMGYDHD